VRIPLALAAVACGSQHAPAKPRRAPYLPLFDRGKTWSLPIEITDGHKDKQTGAYVADQTAHGTARCTVADVRAVGDAKIARLACSKPYDDLLAAGVWVATRTGLFHPPVEPTGDDVATYQQGEPLISAKPAEHGEGNEVEDSSRASEAFEFEHSWCVREAAAAELDRRDYTLCFDTSGISGGGEIVIVGPDETWHRARFGKVPRDPNDPTERK
jgi:hypothetical protein